MFDTGLDSLKTLSKKEVHKAGEFLGNTMMSNDDEIVRSNKNQEMLKNLLFP